MRFGGLPRRCCMLRANGSAKRRYKRFLFCAGFWEIIEFLTDCVMHMGVQYGNTDTMGDIVARYLGGVCFQLHKLFESRKFFTKDRVHSFFKGEILPAGKDETPEGEKIPAGKV